MEKGEAAGIPAPAIPALGQAFAVISDKGKWKPQQGGLRDHPQAGLALTTATLDKDGLLQQGGSPWATIPVLLVSLIHTALLTLQNKAAHARCPWPEAEMV